MGAVSVRTERAQCGLKLVESAYLDMEEGSAEGPLLSASVFGKLEAFPESSEVAVEICSWRQAKASLLI